MVGLYLTQCHRVGLRRGLQPTQGIAVHGHGARGQAALHDQVVEKALCLGVWRHGLRDQARRRASPALAISPMRARNSVPMSAL